MIIPNKQHILQGKSRKAYFFTVCTPDHDFSSTPCIYIYTNLTKNGLGHDYFEDVYCGETDNMQERASCHSSKQDITSKYTHICICPVSSKEEAKFGQDDLLASHNFPLNKQRN